MMNCPVDQTPLKITERQGVEIDYCPQCRGVWLDRGELDKLIERDQQAYTHRDSRDEHHRDDRDQREHYDRDDRRHSDDNHHDSHKKHKKEGLFGELFDF